MIPFSKLYYTVFELPCKFRRHVWYGQNIVVQSRTGRRTFPNLIYKGRRPLATDSEKWRDTVQTFWRCCMLIDTYWYIYIYIYTYTFNLIKDILFMMQRWPLWRWSMSSITASWHRRPSLQLFSTAAAALCHAWLRQMMGCTENFIEKSWNIPWEGGMSFHPNL